MKCISKFHFGHRRGFCLLLAISVLLFTGCGKEELVMPYGTVTSDDNYTIDEMNEQMQIKLFASDYCATETDITSASSMDTGAIYSAGVYDINNKNVLYSYQGNVHVNPASLTKIMTAILTLQYGNLDENVTIGNITIYEDGIQLFGFQEGDVVKLRDLLYVTLVYSGNDGSMALAQYIGGNEETFVDMMNQKALEIGATNTHFVNPHGLTDENHYTTAYDLYLMFYTAMQYPQFREIISTSEYTFDYRKSNGEPVTKTIRTTNKYLTGDYTMPGQIAIIGGKTGSTSAAGKCIIIYLEDDKKNPYISVIMGASDEQSLYTAMTNLCQEVIP